MNSFDNLVNGFITPNSITAGVGTVFLSFFTGKIAPKMPKKFYDLLDNTIVRVIIVAFLVNQQIHKPTLAVLISVIMVLGFEVIIKVFAPDSPSLASLVKETVGGEDDNDKKKSQQGCNCYCNSTVYTEEEIHGKKRHDAQHNTRKEQIYPYGSL